MSNTMQTIKRISVTLVVIGVAILGTFIPQASAEEGAVGPCAQSFLFQAPKGWWAGAPNTQVSASFDTSSYAGLEALVELQVINNDSVHPGNRLDFVVDGVIEYAVNPEEAEGQITPLAWEGKLGNELKLVITFGKDGISSLGGELSVTCADVPVTTTSTTVPATTTTAAPATTSTTSTTVPIKLDTTTTIKVTPSTVVQSSTPRRDQLAVTGKASKPVGYLGVFLLVLGFGVLIFAYRDKLLRKYFTPRQR